MSYHTGVVIWLFIGAAVGFRGLYKSYAEDGGPMDQLDALIHVIVFFCTWVFWPAFIRLEFRK